MITIQNLAVAGDGFQTLRSRFRGALLRPGEEGYDEARRVWNGAIDRRPALIARCAGSDDVVEAVRFARENDLIVAIRSGGHSVAGLGVCDGGVMIDLSHMKAVRVDPVARTVRASGGMLLGDVDKATQAFGMAAPAGIVSHTGIGGLTLGGGLGHLMRKHGLTIDNLQSVDIVTANGDLMHVDAETEPDLFWGIRGGGGNFGIVTTFELRLHQVGPMVLAGPIFWPIDDAHEVLQFVNEFAREAPDELGIAFTVRLAPPAPFLRPDQYGKPVVGTVLVWCGDPAEGQRVIAPLRKIGNPIADAVTILPFVGVQSMLDGGAPHGLNYYWRSSRVQSLSNDVIDSLLDRIGSIASPFSQITGFAVGGAVSRVDASATAIGEREPGFEVNIVAATRPNSGDFEPHVNWVRAGSDALRPHNTGVFSHFLSDEGAAGVALAYGNRMSRLTALKDRYDPTNFFRINANIPPSGFSAT